MFDLSDEEITLLRGIADRLREESSSILYGFFHGGDPNDFYPDHESCTPEEIEAHAQAVASYVEGEDLPGDRHVLPGIIVTTARFGIGTYVVRDPTLHALARQLDDWIDAVRKEA